MARVKKKVIVIDYGHVRHDSGAVANDLQEATLNQKIGHKVYKQLKKVGYKVIVTKGDLNSRWRKANAKNAQLFVSIHQNCYKDSKASGVEVCVPSLTKHAKILDLAKNISDDISKTFCIPNRGLKARPELAVLKYTEMPALLIECGFISCKKDVKKLYTKEGIKRVAKIISNNIMKLY